MLTHDLAADEAGCWRVVFVPEELHLYVELAPADGAASDDWMTIEDFLAFVPTGETHQRALDSLVALLKEMLR